MRSWVFQVVWTPETLRASQSERDTSVPCCLYLSEDSNALSYISGGGRGRAGVRAVRVQSPMHAVHTWPKVLVWTPDTLRAPAGAGGRRGAGGWGAGARGRAGGTGHGLLWQDRLKALFQPGTNLKIQELCIAVSRHSDVHAFDGPGLN